jgi:hypothetical protein
MKIVGLIEAPVEFLREQLADRALSGPRYTENDYDHMTIRSDFDIRLLQTS